MALPAVDTLASTLKDTFGFSAFRPLQREIMEETLGGRDVLALLPTGGGKSLCYQLPALVRSGLTLVVSPLIALMKDQVDSLLENGVKAAYLNSSLSEDESKDMWRQLFRGEIKILYLSPERLLLEGMLDTLEQLKLEFVAVDEAHCISSWGHDFRPEYRALKAVRERFPKVPMLALTASATERVRHDIVEMLALKNPKNFVASFNRPNLSYRIVPRLSPIKQILEIVEGHKDESGIIYCLSRARTEAVALDLTKKGISAEAYHAGLTAAERTKRQERFVKDETQVMVATIAFGMGIDKPDVRFVIHHDLPKNIESYYQETGRAGRDGLPSECVMLYSSSDAAKLRVFIDQLTDATEREVSSRQLSRLLQFAESSECRRVSLLGYFGETYCDEHGELTLVCGACDNCLTPRQEVDATEVAQKMISCVLRVQKHSGFAVGLNHIVDVLLGAQVEKIKKWGHDSLSTYGAGKGKTKAEWLYFGRELVTAGLLSINHQHFNTVEVTSEGLTALKEKRTIRLRAPLGNSGLSAEKRKEQRQRLGALDYDEDVFNKLRLWRVGVAKQKGIPAYMVFSDATLQAVAAKRPQRFADLRGISGIGEKKLELYGESIIELLAEAQDVDC
jgi:ATP-dependent DNA helicase RecQ